ELQVEIWRAPVRFGAVDVLDLDDDVGRRAPGGLQPVEDSRPKGRVACEYRFETAARFARGGDNRYLDSIERKYARAAAGRLDPLLDGIQNRVHDFKRLARAGSDEGFRRFVELCRDPRFEPSSFSENVHARSLHQSGMRCRVDDFSGGRRRAAASVARVLDHDGERNSSGGGAKWREADEPRVRRPAVQLRRSGLAGDATGMVPQRAA